MPFGMRNCPKCGEEMYACPYCTATFATKQELRTHLRDKHKQPGA